MNTVSIFPILLVITGIFLAFLANHLASCLPGNRAISLPICEYCLRNQPWGVFFMLRKCPECGRIKSRRFWLLLVLIPILFLFITNGDPTSLNFWITAVLSSYFTTVFVIDLEHQVILDQTTYFGAIIGLIAGIFKVGWVNTLLGGLIGFFVFFLAYLLGRILFSKIKIRGEGYKTEDPIGFGDVKLAGVIGLVLGWPLVGVGLLAAVFIGGIVSVIFISYKIVRGKYQPFFSLPYGTFLIAGMVFALLFT